MMAALRKDMPWRLGRLLEGLATLPAEADVEVQDLCSDSRRIGAGGLFIAYPGYQGDGRDYIDDALARGAAAVLWHQDSGSATVAWSQAEDAKPRPVIGIPRLKEQVGVIADRFFGSPSRSMAVTGVTGTNGKTSCTHYLAHALGDEKCAIVGTLGWGFAGQLQHTTHTTPDVITLHRALAALHGRGARAIAMEVSSHALDQGRVAGVQFDCAVFTNLTHDHLDYHGDMDSYGEAKRLLFRTPDLKHAVINVDDPFGMRLLEGLAPQVHALTYAIAPAGADVTASDIHAEPGGLQFVVRTSEARVPVHVPLLGRFNVSNVLAVLAVLLTRGLDLEAAARRVAHLQAVPGRMQQFEQPGFARVVVDYAHTPAALEHALQALREHSLGELWCVFGCGGDRDRSKRAPMGGIAEALADHVILTNDNPRSEDPLHIVRDIQEGMQRPARAQLWPQRDEAISQALGQAKEEDVVLIAGKGHEDYQLIGDQRLPFSDAQQVLRFFRGAPS